MSSIFDVSVSSDSEGDADYVPMGEAPLSDSSGDEASSGEDDAIPKAKRRKTKKSFAKPNEQAPEVKVDKPEPAADPKKHADNIWQSFLKDVEQNSPPKPCTQTSSEVCADTNTTPSSAASTPVEKAATPVPKKRAPETVASTKVYEYAGETFHVQESFTIDTDYDPNNVTVDDLPKPTLPQKPTTTAAAEANPKKRGGVASVLGSLMNKKQKVTTLQKTLYDWKSFKKDEGIEEDLDQFNKGRNGYIERQRFLHRSDVRSFEAEKSARAKKKK